MTRDDIDTHLLALKMSGCLPAYDADLLAESLLSEVLERSGQLPPSTVTLLIATAAMLKREHAHAVEAVNETARVIDRARQR